MTLLRRLIPTPLWPRWLIIPVLAFVATVTDRHYLADYWHHLARGRAIVENAQIVDQDLFTFTVAGQPLRDVNWLTQVAYYLLDRLDGLRLVQVANSLVIALTFAVLVNTCRRRAGSLTAGMIAAGIAFLGVWEVLTIRPQTASMLLFVLVFDLLERSRRRPWLLIAVPVLIALWANLHGAFPAGMMLVGCFALAETYGLRTAGSQRTERGRRVLLLTICMFACCLAAAVNPYGFGIIHFVTGTASAAHARQIAEWARPGPDRLIGIVWLLTLAAVVGLAGWRWHQTGRLPTAVDVCTLGCFLVLSCGAVRMVAWWMLAAAPVLAELVAWVAPRAVASEPEATLPSTASTAMCGLFGAALLFSLPGLDQWNPLLGPTRHGPRLEEDLEAATRYLAANKPPGNLYSHFEWGEYLSWSAPPRNRIFMDCRIEIYPDDIWDDYTAITFAAPAWQALLDQYHVDYLILDAQWHGRTGLLAAVAASPHWTPAFHSGAVRVFVRAPGVNQDAAQE
jgi:hypothetical protein